jgi:hypothetical protein
LKTLPIFDCRLPIGRMMQVEQRNELMAYVDERRVAFNQQSTINNRQSAIGKETWIAFSKIFNTRFDR